MEITPKNGCPVEKTGIVPDHRVFDRPLGRLDLAVEKKLIVLIETGWLKARSIGTSIDCGDRINALMTARRYPDDRRFHVQHMKADEIKQIKLLLDRIGREVAMILYLASTTPDSKAYNGMVQNAVRTLLRRNYVCGVNVRTGMDKNQVARFWGFIGGRRANRDDLDFVLGKLKLLMALLA